MQNYDIHQVKRQLQTLRKREVEYIQMSKRNSLWDSCQHCAFILKLYSE